MNWSFKKKIDYLDAKGILRDSAYKLLDRARTARNKIHGETELSEQDYALFSVASSIVSNLWLAVVLDREEEIDSKIRDNAEKMAE